MKVFGNLDLRSNGKLRLYESSGGGTNFVSLRAPSAQGADVEFIFPGADLSSGAMVSDGSGNLSFALLVNANVSGSAAIAYSKLNLASSIVNADIAGAAAIAESKLALSFSTSSLNSAIAGKLSLAGGTMSGAVNFGGFALGNVGVPSANSDAATKLYVDNAVNGLAWKQPVRVASTANIAIATGLEAGDTVDGITLVAGDRVLLKDQSTTSQNGIYVAVASGAASRAADMDSLTPIDEVNGAACFVLEGTANGDKAFVETAAVATLGTDPITFAQFSAAGAYTGGDGITITGADIAVDHDGQGLQFTSNQLALELDGSTLSKSASGVKVATGGIANNEVASGAAIAFSKMAALTASRALVSDGSGVVSVSTVTSAEVGHLSGVTSAIQTQLGGKVADTGDTMTGNLVMNAQSEVRFADSDSSAYIGLRSPAVVAASLTYDLPEAPGVSGHVLSSTTGGVMSWVAQSTVLSAKTTWVTGDGSSKSFTHSLGTTDVVVQVFDIDSGETINPDTVLRFSVNRVDLTASQAPAGSGWRILVVAI